MISPDYITQVISAWTTFYTCRRCTLYVKCIYSLRKMGRCWHDLKPVTRYNRKTATKDTTDRQRQPATHRDLCVCLVDIFMKRKVCGCLLLSLQGHFQNSWTFKYRWLWVALIEYMPYIFPLPPPPRYTVENDVNFLIFLLIFRDTSTETNDASTWHENNARLCSLL